MKCGEERWSVVKDSTEQEGATHCSQHHAGVITATQAYTNFLDMYCCFGYCAIKCQSGPFPLATPPFLLSGEAAAPPPLQLLCLSRPLFCYTAALTVAHVPASYSLPLLAKPCAASMAALLPLSWSCTSIKQLQSNAVSQATPALLPSPLLPYYRLLFEHSSSIVSTLLPFSHASSSTYPAI